MRFVRNFFRSGLSMFVGLCVACSPDPSSNPPAEAPTLSAVSPAVGPSEGGVELELEGQNFVSGAMVSIAGAAVMPVTVVSPTRIRTTLPAKQGAWGKVPVLVQNPDGKQISRDDLFAYHATNVDFQVKTYPSGSQSREVAVADFNNDKKLDVIVRNQDSLAILLGDGLGGFGAATIWPTSTYNSGMAVGSFNSGSDAIPDVVVTDANNNRVRLLLADGTGLFRVALNFPAGIQPYSVVAGDFNGDKNLDVVVTNPSSNNINVLLGNGTTGFGSAFPISTGASRPVCIAAGDWNGDGKTDVVTFDIQGGTICVLFGNGAGNFGSPNYFLVGTPFDGQPAVHDFNADQKLDLAGGRNSAAGSILLGDGMGGFNPGSSLPQGHSIVTGDFNGDLKADLAVQDMGSMRILLGDGMGGFKTASSFDIGLASYGLMATGDFNGDQKLDLVTFTNIPSDNAIIFINRSQ